MNGEKEEIKKVSAPITLFEAALIRRLRKYKFGKVVVSIQRGNPVFVAVKENKTLTKEDGLELEGAIAIDPLNT